MDLWRRRRILLWLFLAAQLLDVTLASKGEFLCPGETWKGNVVDEEPRLVETDRSGERFEVGTEGDTLKILHVYGSPYELGRAHGALFKVEIQAMYQRLFSHLEDEWITLLHLTLLPDLIARKIARVALNAALDATYLLALKYIPARNVTSFVDEMLGLSQGAEVDYLDVVRVQMIPELFEASCAMLGSWGPATEHSSEGGLYQMRSLDWDMTAPLLDYHLVIYFHPSDGHSFAIFTWAGFIGCISGYSGSLGVSEKVWLGYSGSGSHRGMPWHFLLRDVLQFTRNLDEAWRLLEETTRTCPIFVGIGSLDDKKFVLVEYSSDILELLDDSNFTTVTSSAPGYNEFPGVIFVDKFPQPSDDKCMSSVVQDYYGNLDEKALMDMVSRQQTGEMHIALYDFMANTVYFSWAVKNTSGHVIPAYERHFVKLNMSTLFYPKPECVPSDKGFDYCMISGKGNIRNSSTQRNFLE